MLSVHEFMIIPTDLEGKFPSDPVGEQYICWGIADYKQLGV